MIKQAATHLLSAGDMVWDSEGYHIFGEEDWKDHTIKARFTYSKGTIGLSPRMQSEGAYILFEVSNNIVHDENVLAPEISTGSAVLRAVVLENEVSLGSKEIPLLLEGRTYDISIVVKRNNFKVYLNGNLIFNTDYSLITQGKPALYASPGNSCLMIEVTGSTPKYWENNIKDVNAATISNKKKSNGDVYTYLVNEYGEDELYMKEIFDVEGDQFYTLSLGYQGRGKMRIEELGGENNQSTVKDLAESIAWKSEKETIRTSPDCKQVEIFLICDSVVPLSLDKVQFEPLSFYTAYIENNEEAAAVREASYISYPAKGNIFSEQGTVSMWVKAKVVYSPLMQVKPTFFEYGEGSRRIRLYSDGEAVLFQYGEESVSKLHASLDEWTHVVCSWGSIKPKLYVNGVEATVLNRIDEGEDVGSTLIRVGHSVNTGYDVFQGMIDSLIIFKKEMTQQEVQYLYGTKEAPEKSNDMLLYASFDYEIAPIDKSILEISPAPQYGSPIVVENEKGEPLNKVSFFDWKTGEFQTFVDETVIYNEKLNYVEIGMLDIEMDKFKTTIRDEEGNVIGEPYENKGRRIYMKLSKEQKRKYHNAKLRARYQPQNPYTVDFNIGTPDAFRVSLGKHNGDKVEVMYEGNRFSKEKLATMIEMNPMSNPNHQGFMYLTQNAQEVSALRISVSPRTMLADGISEAVLIVEPVDRLGNFVSNVKLDLIPTEGSIIPSLDPKSIELRQIAGRFIYKYRAPLIRLSDRKKPSIKDTLNIIDRKSGIGVQTSIFLDIKEEYDVDYAVSLPQENWERLGSYLLDKVMDYFGQRTTDLPAEIGELFDFNGDGIIGLDEIIWLNDHKFSNDLYDKYAEVVAWERKQ